MHYPSKMCYDDVAQQNVDPLAFKIQSICNSIHVDITCLLLDIAA